MEKTRVVFSKSGEVGKYWSYIAWYGTFENRLMTAELINGQYHIFHVNRHEEIVRDPLRTPAQIDAFMRNAVRLEAEKISQTYKTTIDDRVSESE